MSTRVTPLFMDEYGQIVSVAPVTSDRAELLVMVDEVDTLGNVSTLKVTPSQARKLSDALDHFIHHDDRRRMDEGDLAPLLSAMGREGIPLNEMHAVRRVIKAVSGG